MSRKSRCDTGTEPALRCRVAHIPEENSSSRRLERRLTSFVLVAAIAVWTLNAVIRWYAAAPLGHDEARYALDARDLLTGTPSRFLYSASGMSIVPIPGLLAGGSERALRLLPMLLGFAFLFAVWLLAKTTRGHRTAAWTVAVLAASPQLAVHGSELLSDLPSATCLLLAITILTQELTIQPQLRPRVLWVGPLCATAFYLRFGSCVSVAIIGVTFAIVGRRSILARPWLVGATFGLLVAALVPHVVRSIHLTGSVTGILRLSAAIPGEAKGISAYLASPVSQYGVVVFAAMVAGVAGAWRDRIAITFAVIALAQVGVLASTTQAQPRFIYLATVLLVILGVDTAGRLLDQLRAKARTGIVIMSMLLLAASCGNELLNGFTHRERRFSGAWKTYTAAAIIRADHSTERYCEAVAPRDQTRLEWYSGCRSGVRPTGEPAVVYTVRDGKQHNPPANAVLVALLPGLLDVVRAE